MAYTRQLCACASVCRWFLHLHPHAQATSTTDFSLEWNEGRHWSSNSNKSLTFQSMIMHCPYAQSDKLKQRVLFCLGFGPSRKRQPAQGPRLRFSQNFMRCWQQKWANLPVCMLIPQAASSGTDDTCAEPQTMATCKC